jgi:hypothetical protein
MIIHKKSKISGNILFIILIAIGLFAALGSVVMDGESTTNKISEDKAKIYAQDILAYANAMEGAVQRMLDRGVSENDLCFDFDEYPGGNADYEHAACSETKNRVFHPSGGGMRHRTPDADYFDSAFNTDFRTGQYLISAQSEVYGIPQASQSETDMQELILFTHGLKKEICTQINNHLNKDNPGGIPPEEGGSVSRNNSTIYFVGSYTVAGFNISGKLSDHARYCVQSSGTGNFQNGYVYYHVLHAR